MCMTNFALILNDLAASYKDRNEYIARLCSFPLLILSNLVRAISFDETGYKGSEMYVVKPAVRMSRAETFWSMGNASIPL